MAKPTPAPKALNLKGTAGNDTLTGGALGDTIDGGKGNDTLIGNAGGDTLIGGAGADTFKYLSFSDSVSSTGIDRITDFSAAAGDKVDLTALGTATLQTTYTSSFTGLQAIFAFNAATNVTTLSYYSGSSTPVFQLAFTGNISFSQGAFLGINQPPALTGTAATLSGGTEDTSYVVSTASLLAGWSDADGNTLSIANLTADHGSVADNGDGTYTITPASNYNGPVTLSYKVSDGTAAVNASLGFSLDAVNDAPALTGTAATLAPGSQNTGYTVTAAQLLDGWSDVDSAALSVINLSADHGAVVDNGDGTYTITPAANYYGVTTLTYDVSDGTTAASTTLLFSLAGPSPSNDDLVGTSGDDTIDLLGGNDSYDGLAGNDTITGDAGNDTMTGGSGDDTFNVNGGSDTVFGDDGDDSAVLTNLASGETRLLYGGTGFDTLDASSSNIAIGIGISDNLVTDPFGASTAAGSVSGFERFLGSAFGDYVNFYYATESVNLEGRAGNDTLAGGFANDVLDGGADNDILEGGDGDDLLLGGAGDDTLIGGAGNDQLIGGWNDAPGGSDTLTGGTGDDVFGLRTLDNSVTITDFVSGQDRFFLSVYLDSDPNAGGLQTWYYTSTYRSDLTDKGQIVAGSDAAGYTLTFYQAGDTTADAVVHSNAAILLSDINPDYIQAAPPPPGPTEGDDILSGTSGNDNIDLLGGNDSYDGKGGDDTISGGAGDDALFGRAGSNTAIFIGTRAQYNVTDLGFLFFSVQDTTANRDGTDTLANIQFARFSDGTLEIRSGEFAPTGSVLGTPRNDIILLQQGGNDTVYGFDGLDVFYFGGAFTASDAVFGGGGSNDIILLQGDYSGGLVFGSGTTSNISGIETIFLLSGGDAGFGDTANNSYDYNLTTIDANVAAGSQLKIDGSALRVGEDFTINGSAETNGSFLIVGGSGVNSITGGAQADTLNGGSSFDTINGGFGNDIITGDAGNDRLAGGDGNDSITGGLDADNMNGGGGSDTFIYLSPTETTNAAPDIIIAFEQGLDKIDLSAIDANSLTPPQTNEAFTFIGSSAFDGTAGELRATAYAPNPAFTVVQGDIDGDGQADFTIIVAASVQASDFIL